MSQQFLSLNFAPVDLIGESEVTVGFRPYDEQVLRDLRAEFSETHVFRRDWETEAIIDIPITAEAEPLADKTSDIDLRETPKLWAALLNAAVLRSFHKRREIVADYPIEVLGNPKANFVQHEDLRGLVQVLPLMQFTPRTIYKTNTKPSFGLLCDVRTKSRVIAKCSELVERGVNLVGRYVMVDVPSRDYRVEDRPITVGRVARSDGDTLFLDDHRDGFETVSASDARLTASRVDFDWLINSINPNSAHGVLSGVRERIGQLKSGPGRLETIAQTLKFLEQDSLDAVPGLKFSVGEMVSTQGGWFPDIETIDKPSLVFDPAGTRNDNWNERGIKKNGPYDQRTFTPKQLKIAVICQAQFEGQVDAFMAKFLDGMPKVTTGANGREPYGDGFLRRFKLERPYVETFTTSSPSMDGYLNACEEALQNAADTGEDWDLAVVQIEENFKQLPGSQNPYFATKAMLLRNHVAVQNVRIETMREQSKSLVFTMNQLSLATYAKLGGRPWLLSAQQTVAHELVIGLGSHMESTGRFGPSARHVGITTVFSSDGSYHLSERTGVVKFEEYAATLTESLKRTIQQIRAVDNWKSSDRVRLIFHMFKPPKDVEAEAIKAAVEGLELENVTYAFIHIAPSHPFVLFDHNQSGLPAWQRDAKKRKGVLGPSRGTHLKLGDFESLVVFSGASELKKASDGLPTACLLKLHRNSTFKDMTYLARQAFDFTAHSWRVMSPEPFPITIKYSAMIAERLTGLKQVANWDDDAVKFREIGRTPWFL